MNTAPVDRIFDDCFREKFHSIQCPLFEFLEAHPVNDITYMFLASGSGGIDIFFNKSVGVLNDF